MDIKQISSAPTGVSQHDQLRKVASDLEAAFLAEMLKHTGLGESRDAFGGGVGEEHFSAMLGEAHAKALSEAGGIGLAEHIFKSLMEKQNA